MKAIVHYVHPLRKTTLKAFDGGFVDSVSGERFPLVRGIPRFCVAENYSESFGYQWNLFDRTQLDIFSGVQHSTFRFYGETGWTPIELENCRVLEVGSGAGRFSEVFLRTTQGILHSFDYSSAVEANWGNNGHYGERLRLIQASVYAMPFPDGSFDKIFCLGVLQHTPSFEGAIKAIVEKARVGGEIVVDFYPIKGWYTKIHSKYFLRPFTKRLSKKTLLRLIELNADWMLAAFDLLCKLRLGFLSRFIPITDVRLFPAGLSSIARREWAIMDTFDGLSPQYDNPQRIAKVVRMFQSYGCEVRFSGITHYPHGSSTVVRAIRVR